MKNKLSDTCMKVFSIVGSIPYYAMLSSLFVLFFLIFVLIFIFITPFDRGRKIMHKVSRVLSILIIRVCPFWNIEVIGREKIDPKQTYIITPNHQSMMDIPLIGVAIPLVFRFISKREVYRIPFIGWILWLRNDIGIRRGGVQSAKRMLKEAKQLTSQNISIIIFPEGTRTKTGRVNEFKEGAFITAKSTSTSILPVVIDGTWILSSYLGGFLKMPAKLKIIILDPIDSAVIKEMSLKELANYTHDIILTTHKQIDPDAYNC